MFRALVRDEKSSCTGPLSPKDAGNKGCGSGTMGCNTTVNAYSTIDPTIMVKLQALTKVINMTNKPSSTNIRLPKLYGENVMMWSAFNIPLHTTMEHSDYTPSWRAASPQPNKNKDAYEKNAHSCEQSSHWRSHLPLL